MTSPFDKAAFFEKLRAFRTYAWQKERRPLTIFVSSLLVVVLLILTKPSGKARDTEELSHPVEVSTIRPKPYDTTLYLYGTIETPNKSKLVSTVTTDVLNTPVKEGAVIRKDDILIELDPLEPTLITEERMASTMEIEGLIASENNRHEANLKALEQEKIQYDLMQRALDRQTKLASQSVASEAAVDKAKSDLAQQALTITARELEIADHKARLAQLNARLMKAQAQQTQAERDLSRTTLKSPFNGRVAQLYVAPLDRVTPGTPLIDIYNDDALEVRAQIPSRYLTRLYQQLSDNQPVEAQAMVDGMQVPLKLLRLSGEVRAGRGGIDALFAITEPMPNLALGRPVDMLLSLQNTVPVIAIPYTALYSYDRVFKVVDDRLQGVTVERMGERINAEGETELLVTSDELHEGDAILISLLPNATTGMKVEVR